MRKILQITDIHLHGEYDGRFNVKEHFERILADTRGQDFAAVVLTGDLVDDKSEYNPIEPTVEDYTYIFDRIVDTFGIDTPLLVVPGNHDNRKTLDAAYEAYLARGYKYKHCAMITTYGGSFEEPGRKFVVLKMPNPENGYGFEYLVGMDNAHNDVPHKAMQELIKIAPCAPEHVYYLFVHKPLIKPFHRFMNGPQYSIDENVAKTFLLATQGLRIQGIFCGHYHCPSIDSWDRWTQYVAPSSQGQLDPFSAECVPSGNYPGYAVIDLDEQIKAKFKFIPESNVDMEVKNAE